jgi:hypothetical protein
MRTPGLITVFFALGLASAGRAQIPVASSADPASSPVLEAAKPASTAPVANAPASIQHERLMSDKVAATLASSLPKYQPPKAAGANTDAESPDLREIDKPKNGIIRLPKFTVQKPKEPRPPVFRERELLTQKGLMALVMKRYPGLRLGNLFGLNEGIALLMYEEQVRLDDLAEFADQAGNARNAGDLAAANAILSERTRIAYRPSDIGGSSHAPGQ